MIGKSSKVKQQHIVTFMTPPTPYQQSGIIDNSFRVTSWSDETKVLSGTIDVIFKSNFELGKSYLAINIYDRNNPFSDHQTRENTIYRTIVDCGVKEKLVTVSFTVTLSRDARVTLQVSLGMYCSPSHFDLGIDESSGESTIT
ncbi:hypothetical protein DFA_06289 [Cavenderia fasciculata]|uniref:Uncharacterized protein n=1 Tax=Cavenderia fasciculata TaxID=261658 RepID=F4PKL9_CACFS|nr:uncharacterized protein DFA_06289 [Cavenderia fasciculata]EGG24143.1 hypothetical protein DFA_06289 [Cavenderia fasciculata]|eukprot:XP_004361994.1 hypothetical protein DFA_06289 [Cavenderia fasciculata]